MKSNRYHFARLRRQLRFLIKQYNRQQDSATNFSKQHLTEKIRLLSRRLVPSIGTRQLARLFSGAAFSLFLSWASPAIAQPFGAFQEDPFGIISNNDLMVNTFVDIDNDGDLDLFTAGPGNSGNLADIDFYENIGTATAPSFANPVPDPFGLNPFQVASIDFADIDNDGDLDAFYGTAFGQGMIEYAENIGSPEAPVFGSPLSNPFGIDIDAAFAYLELKDMDADGDFDLLAAKEYGDITYFENTGTLDIPTFATAINNPFGLDQLPPIADLVARLFHWADFDGDCDLDLFYYAYSGFGTSGYFFVENEGTSESPSFLVPTANPFGLNLPIVNSNYPEFADLDADGDLDLMLGVYYNDVFYYQNLRNNNAPTSEDASLNTLINTPLAFEFTNFPFNDIDGDFLQGIRITGLPDLGELTFNGIAVEVNDFIPVAELTNLVFTPGADASASPYASFQFQVTDGTEFDCTEYTMTINVLVSSATTDLFPDGTFQISPNPARDQIQLMGQVTSTTNTLNAKILDTQGRIVELIPLPTASGNFSTTIDIFDLTPGMYLLQISDEERTSMHRFIKN